MSIFASLARLSKSTNWTSRYVSYIHYLHSVSAVCLGGVFSTGGLANQDVLGF